MFSFSSTLLLRSFMASLMLLSSLVLLQADVANMTLTAPAVAVAVTAVLEAKDRNMA